MYRYDEYNLLYNEDGTFFLEDSSPELYFNEDLFILEQALNEAVENVLIEHYEVFNEAIVINEKYFIDTSEKIIKEIQNMLGKILTNAKRVENKEALKKEISRLNNIVENKISKLEDHIKNDRWDKAARESLNTSILKMMNASGETVAVMLSEGHYLDFDRLLNEGNMRKLRRAAQKAYQRNPEKIEKFKRTERALKAIKDNEKRLDFSTPEYDDIDYGLDDDSYDFTDYDDPTPERERKEEEKPSSAKTSPIKPSSAKTSPTKPSSAKTSPTKPSEGNIKKGFKLGKKGKYALISAASLAAITAASTALINFVSNKRTASLPTVQNQIKKYLAFLKNVSKRLYMLCK